VALATARADLRGWATVDTGPFDFTPVALTLGASLRREDVTFGRWMTKARPDHRWDYRHFVEMQRVLDQVTTGEIRRVLFQVAIRHGKTEHNSVGYAAYRLEQDPSTRVLVGSYNQTQAHKISRDIRSLAKAQGVEVSRDRDTAGEWETTGGGGVRAFGSGAGVASVNADLIIIDDPIGSRDEAESQAHRDRVFDWITSDLLARCEPHTAVLFTMSRWHTDDPAGRIIDRFKDRWVIVDMPGRAEPQDPLGRAENEPLWPELRGEAWLDEKRAELLEYGFASLIQGRPRPREGGMFKWSWWLLLGEVPAQGRMIRYWDLAGTAPKGKGHDPDYSAGPLLCRMADKRTAIVDVERFRKSIAQRDAELERICKADMEKYRGRISWWIETEAGIAGEERTAQLVRNLQALGMTVYTEHPTGKKVHRAEPLASAAEAGNVLLCGTRGPEGNITAPWMDAFRSEAADFPNGTHDDQIDGAGGAFSKLSGDIPWQPVRVAF
jgi:predicted phage terminase large subunit-like protein